MTATQTAASLSRFATAMGRDADHMDANVKARVLGSIAYLAAEKAARSVTTMVQLPDGLWYCRIFKQAEQFRGYDFFIAETREQEALVFADEIDAQ